MKRRRSLIFGHETALGRGLFDALRHRGEDVRTDLTEKIRICDPVQVGNVVNRWKPERVYLLHVASAGIAANVASGADLMLVNLKAQIILMEAAACARVKRFLYLASSCVYPAGLKRALCENDLWTGPVETTSASYAIAKIAGIYLAQALARQKKLSAVIGIPATVYGPGDHVDEHKSHVLSGMMLRLHRALSRREKIFTIWGSGRPRREFIYVDDAVRACRVLMDRGKAGEIYNFGSGEEIRVAALARRIASAVGFKGRLRFDRSRPDGASRKLLDSSKMRALGWTPRVRLDEGIPTTYEQFLQNYG